MISERTPRQILRLFVSMAVLAALIGTSAESAIADETPPPVITSFTAGSSLLRAPESTVITATTERPIANGTVSIVNLSSGETVAICDSGSACSYVVHATWENNRDLVPASFGAVVNNGAPSYSLEIEFARRTFNVALSAGTNPVRSGEATPVTATVDYDLSWTGYTLSIYDADSNELKTSCSGGSSCTFIFNAGWENNSALASRHYYAVVTGFGDQPSNTANLSVGTERVTFNVGMAASVNPVKAGQSSMVTATVAQNIGSTGFALKIY